MPIDAAKREIATPWKALGAERSRVGTNQENSEEERSSREDEPYFVRNEGTVCGWEPSAPTETSESVVGVGNPIFLQAACIQDSEGAANLMRGT